MRRRNSWIVGVSLAVLNVPAAGQQAEVTGARITLVPKPAVVEMVTLENRRNSPLSAWEIGLIPPGASAARINVGSDFFAAIRSSLPGSGPIQPGERRVIEVTLPDGETVGSVMVRMAIYEDGVYEGERDVFERWRKLRDERASEHEYWMRAIDRVPRGSGDDARRYLNARLVERAGQQPRDDSGLREQLRKIAGGTGEWADMAAGMARIRTETERAFAALTRPLSALASADGSGLVAKASSRQVDSTKYVAAIQNLRNVPIEAVGFEYIEAGADRPRGGQTVDFCTADPDASGPNHGSIAPGATREFSIGFEIKESALPQVRIGFVLYDDLTFEGDARQRDALLRRREVHADDVAFTQAVWRQVATHSDDAIAFLTAQRAERARQLQSQGRRPEVHMIDQMIEQVKRTGDTSRTTATGMAEQLEPQRQRLLRHLTRGAN